MRWVFFGGEPLLRSMDWFNEAIDVVREMFERYQVEVTISIQTNGTLLDERWAALMARKHVRPCISIDGPAEIHDRCRSGGDRAWRAVHLLRDAEVTPRAVCVLGPHNYASLDRIVGWFLQKGLNAFRVNFVCPVPGQSVVPLSAFEMYNARRILIRRMLDTHVSLHEANSERLMRLWTRRSRRRPDVGKACGAPVCGAGIAHVAFDPDGRVHICDRVITRTDRWQVGDMTQLAPGRDAEEVVRRFHRRHVVPAQCAACVYKQACIHPCALQGASRKIRAAYCAAFRRLAQWMTSIEAEILAWVAREDVSKRRTPGPLVRGGSLGGRDGKAS